MSVETVAAGHYRQQAKLAQLAARAVLRAWRRVDPAAISQSWSLLLAEAFAALTGAQLAAAREADPYVAAILRAQGIDPQTETRVAPALFAGVASDGRTLDTLLAETPIVAKSTIERGGTTTRGMAAGAGWLDMMVRTQVADAGRTAVGVAIASRTRVGGYVRMLNPPSCSRCVILAGKWFRWNAGFQRHPTCDCRHIPSSEDTANELRTDPQAYFRSLSAAEQDRVFTRAGAQAVRDGADLGQVVNARRGAAGLTPAGGRLTTAEKRALRDGRERGQLQPVRLFGRDLFVTTEATTARGVAGVRLGARETGPKAAGARYRTARVPRLVPESIYQIAGDDRDEAVRLLRRFGYII